MRANAVPLVALFETKMRLEIPLFQRQYVWGMEQQWQPLWEDIERKFCEYLEGRLDAPKHFLGAIVLDQKQVPTTHVERRMVIDGQQRLTTLQIFLTAFRDYCHSVHQEDLAKECAGFTLNKGMMPNPEIDKFKIWPTQLDRPFFSDVITAGSPEALKEKYKLVKRKYQRKPDPRPRLVECYLCFFDRRQEFFEGPSSEDPFASQAPMGERLDQCFQALRNSLLVVAIDLEQGDDPQVIFETLNARGEPLLPADLLRNYIFLRASRQGLSQEDLYKTYWEPFDDVFWRENVSQGRIYRPRSDLLIQHYLTSQQAVDIPIKHLYVEYRHWIERSEPFDTIEEELISLSKNRDVFRDLLEGPKGREFSSLAELLIAFDIGTAYPLMLLLALERRQYEIYQIIESYLVRRAICGLTNKNYNRVFVALTRLLRKEGVSAPHVKRYFEDLKGETVVWPLDDKFRDAWLNDDMYRRLNNPRLTFIFKRLNIAYSTTKNEDIVVNNPFSIEHVMPQEWTTNWPLPDGSVGLTSLQLWDIDESDARYTASERRHALLHTIGNLTITTQSLNSSVSNSAWVHKRSQLGHSLLPLNKDVLSVENWNEENIKKRSQELFEKATSIWPNPSSVIL